jgi:soluble lytic murein transglycosylase
VKSIALLSAYLLGVSTGQAACAIPTPAFRVEVEMTWVAYYAHLYAVAPEFVAAIIDAESSWCPYAVSPKGAAGLMQLTPATASAFGVTNRFRAEDNIRGGVAYLGYLIGRFGGELRLVAAAYYAGEKRVGVRGLEMADEDVYRYVSRVERFYRKRRLAATADRRSSAGGKLP